MSSCSEDMVEGERFEGEEKSSEDADASDEQEGPPPPTSGAPKADREELSPPTWASRGTFGDSSDGRHWRIAAG